MPRTYLLSRRAFLWLLGLVYLVAFASLAVQITGLVGEHGLLPAARFLEWAGSIYGGRAWRLFPTVFWAGVGDAALQAVCWAGVLLAGLLMLGIAPVPVLGALWLLYLSLTVVGQNFLSFQWDVLLLEAGLLAVLWAPLEWKPGAAEPPPPNGVRWLLVALLFKLMFLSGVTKLLSGDPTWRSLTALDYHFETQPLPTWPAWYAYHLPHATHRLAAAAMFLGELVAPLLLFAPPRLRALRIGGCAAIALLQLGIALTGNYGFFNLLTLVLCVPALDDDLLRRVLPFRVAARDRPEPRAWRAIGAGLVPAVLVLSALSFVAEIAYTLPSRRGLGLGPGWATTVLGWVAPFRSFNGYGLFRVMTTERPELVVEGSRDGEHWEAYGFRFKPGPLTRRPGFVAPYQPRLDWQMWFAALDPMGNAEWLTALARDLEAGTPEVLALLDRNPFAGAPPRAVRFASYDYRFSTPAERSRTGAWWVRELSGYLPIRP
jgi:hypothetical protein